MLIHIYNSLSCDSYHMPTHTHTYTHTHTTHQDNLKLKEVPDPVELSTDPLNM